MYVTETLISKIASFCVHTLNSTVCYKFSKTGHRRMDELKVIRLHKMRANEN